jgi:hypothetical protein
LPAGTAVHRIESMGRKLAVMLVAAIAAAILAAPVLAGHQHQKSGSARSGSAIVAAKF